MTNSPVFRTITLSALLWLSIQPAHAAGRKDWINFTNCQYVATKDCDGDSFRVRCGTNEFNLRLYFVDAPEPNLSYGERTREQSMYFGITLDQTFRAGIKAGEVVRKLLREPFIVRTRWAMGGGRSREPRYYAFVETGGRQLAEVLVAQGWARSKGVQTALPNGEKARAFADKLHALEVAARSKKAGIWVDSSETATGGR